MSPIDWAVKSVSTKGLLETTKIAASVAADLVFDWRYGTDTIRWVERGRLATQSANQQHSAPYQATKARPLLTLLNRLELPRGSVFLDIGSGKGRVLLIAAQHPFACVRGIEFSGALCSVARRNVETFAAAVKLKAPIEVVEADAAKYAFRPEEQVLFMYNPFGPIVMTRVLDNLRRALAPSSRRTILIYNTPLLHDMITSSGIFEVDRSFNISGTQFNVYERGH